MAAIQKKKIKDLEVVNDGDDIVTNIVIEWTTYDDSDPEEIKTQESKRFTLDVEEVDPSSTNFIPYSDLTSEIVFGWLEKRLNSARIKEMEERMISMINDMANPPSPVRPEIVNKGLPW